MLGVYVKEARESIGLSLLEVSQRAKIPASRLRRIEIGAAPIKPATLESLQAALNLSDRKIENLVEIARIGFINDFMELTWAEGES